MDPATLAALGSLGGLLGGGGGRTSVSTSQSSNIAFNPSIVIGSGTSSPSGSASGSPSAGSNAAGNDAPPSLAQAYPSIFGNQTYQPGVDSLDQRLPAAQIVPGAGSKVAGLDGTTWLILGAAAVGLFLVMDQKKGR